MPYDGLLRLPTKRSIVGAPGQPGGTLPSPATAGNLIIGQGTVWASKALSGAATITAGGVLTLSATGVTAGTYGDATHVGQFTVGVDGRLSFAQNVAITTSSGTVTSISQGTGITLTPNPITSTGTVALANTAVTPGTYGDSTHVGQFTVDQQGRLTFAANVALASSSGPLLDAAHNTDTVAHTPVLGDMIYANATPAWQALAGSISATKKFLTQTGTGSVSAAPSWGDVTAADVTSGQALTRVNDTNVTLTLGGSPTVALLAATSLTLGWTGTLAVSRGGTGDATLTAHGVLIGEGTSAVAVTAAGTSGQLLIGQGATSDPTFNTMSGDATIANTGALTLATVNANVGTFGGTTTVPQLTVNAKGLITAVTNVAIGTGGGGVVDPSKFLAWRMKSGVNTSTGTVSNVTCLAPSTDTGTRSSFEDGTGTYINYLSSTSSGVSAGIQNNGADTQMQLLPDVTFVIKTGANAADVAAGNMSLWIGLHDTGDIGNSNSAANTVAFRFNPSASSDTKWASVTTDGANTLEVNTGLGATVTADTQYVLRIQVVSTSSVNFYINGTLVSNHTLHFPAAATNLGQISRITNNSAGTGRNFRFQSMILAQL